MGEPIVIVAGDQPAGDDGTAAFAAGVAAAVSVAAAETADQAAGQAADATNIASAAGSTAIAAGDTAADALVTAEAAHDRIDALLADLATDEGTPEPVEDPDAPPVVATTVVLPEPDADKDKPKPRRERRTFGSNAWFGSR